MSKIRTMVIAALCALTMAFAFAMPSQAAPVGTVIGGLQLGKAAVGGGLLHQAHGCHRFGVIGPFSGIRHRHIGPGCRWVPARRRVNSCRRWRRICRRRCFDRRFPRRCRARCFDRNAPDRCF